MEQTKRTGAPSKGNRKMVALMIDPELKERVTEHLKELNAEKPEGERKTSFPDLVDLLLNGYLLKNDE